MAPDEDSRRRLQVLVSDESGHRLRAGALTSWLRRVAPAVASGTVNIALVSTAQIRALNRKYRHRNAATDVLSFEGGPDGRGRRPRPPRTDRFLGDIVIARGVAKRQAREAGHSEATELRVLALHGLLHLLGYDHQSDGGTMERVERRLRRKGGLSEGLIERTASGSVSATPRRRRLRALKRP